MNNLIKGFSRISDFQTKIFNLNRNPKLYSNCNEKTDSSMMKKDFKAVGQDMKIAINKFKKND